MYYTQTYGRHLQARLNELEQKKAERQAVLKKKKTHAELQRMINKKLQLEQRLKMLKEIEERRTEIINLNNHHNFVKEEETKQLHLAKVDTLEMMKHSRTIRYRSVDKKIKQTSKERRQRFQNSQQKLFRSTSHSFTQDEIGQVNRAQKKLEIQIEKKAKDYRRLKFNHPQDKLRRPFKTDQNSYHNSRPFSVQITRNHSKQDRCRVHENFFEDLSLEHDSSMNIKLEEQMKLMTPHSSNRN